MHGIEKRVVYILRSDLDPSRHYVGLTNNLRDRLDWHNHDPSGHTLDHRPWSVVVSIHFPTEKAAGRFEMYLKSGSGRAFAKRHFAPVGDWCPGMSHQHNDWCAPVLAHVSPWMTLPCSCRRSQLRSRILPDREEIFVGL